MVYYHLTRGTEQCTQDVRPLLANYFSTVDWLRFDSLPRVSNLSQWKLKAATVCLICGTEWQGSVSLASHYYGTCTLCDHSRVSNTVWFWAFFSIGGYVLLIVNGIKTLAAHGREIQPKGRNMEGSGSTCLWLQRTKDHCCPSLAHSVQHESLLGDSVPHLMHVSNIAHFL